MLLASVNQNVEENNLTSCSPLCPAVRGVLSYHIFYRVNGARKIVGGSAVCLHNSAHSRPSERRRAANTGK